MRHIAACRTVEGVSRYAGTVGQFCEYKQALFPLPFLHLRGDQLETDYPSPTERHHPGINIDFIEERPQSEAWHRIDAYDQLLVDYGEGDIIDHSSSS